MKAVGLMLAAALPLAAWGQASPPGQSDQSVAEAAEPARLPLGEERIRVGVILLNRLHEAMARVKDRESAEAAVPAVMRVSRELQAWGQSFASLPPLDDATRHEYEKRYLPVIQKLNEQIKAQGERLAAAEYYGSQDLPAALARLAYSVQ